MRPSLKHSRDLATSPIKYRGKTGKNIFREIADGKHGNVYTTEYTLMKVLDRYMAVEKKGMELRLLTALYGSLKDGPQLTEKLDVLKVEKQNVEEARRWFFQRQMSTELELLDWSTVSLMKEKNDSILLTFDTNFDALKDVKDPNLPQINRIAIKRPRQFGVGRLFSVGVLSLSLIPALALVSGYLHIVVQDTVYVLLMVLSTIFILSAIFGRRTAELVLKKLPK